MKREYFGMLFLILFIATYLLFQEFFGNETISRFIVIWVLIGYLAGQYSTKFPKIK
jgi:positive regulator of sigma E activity